MKRIFLSVISFFLLAFLVPIHSFATLNTEFNAKELPTSDSFSLFENIGVSITSEEYTGESDVCGFDVNVFGDIAVAFEAPKAINIYDSKGDFVRGFRLSTIPGAFTIEYDERDGDLILVLFRSNTLIKLNIDGEMIAAYSFSTTDEQNAHHIQELGSLYRTIEIKQNGDIYRYEGRGAFERLIHGNRVRIVIQSTEEKNEIIVFDNHASSSFSLRILFIPIIIVGIVVLVILAYKYGCISICGIRLNKR